MIYKNFKFENFRTDVKIGIFSIPIVYRDSGFSSKTIINFEECVKNKKIPKDSPSYLKKSSRKSDERV